MMPREPIHVSHIKNLGGIREEDQNLACNNGNSRVFFFSRLSWQCATHNERSVYDHTATHQNVLISDDTMLARTKWK